MKTLVSMTLATLMLSTAFAQAAQVNTINQPINRAIALSCSAGHGDVAQTIYVTNTTGATIPAGTKIHWKLGTLKGTITLSAALAAGGQVTDLTQPGNGGACTASYTK